MKTIERCGLWDGRPAVTRIAGIPICAEHQRICDEIVAGAPKRRRLRRQARQVVIPLMVTSHCPCGEDFTYEASSGARRKWCPTCQECDYSGKLKRAERARQIA
jgi:hypothetical protein